MSDSNKKITKNFPLSSWAIENKMTVFIIILVIIGWGMYSFFSMPREDFPEIIDDKIYISTLFPGNTAEDVEKLVTDPLEDEIRSVAGIIGVSSVSQNDYSMIIAQIENVEMNQAKLDIKDKIDEAKTKSDWPILDTGSKVEPNVFDLNLAESVPILNINITGDFPIQKIKKFAEILEDRIENLSQIKEVDIRGVDDKEVEIAVDMYLMNGAKVSFQDIINAVSQENKTISGGSIPINGKETNIRVASEINDPSELENIVVKQAGGTVYLRDIATISLKEKEASTFAREFGKPVIMLDVKKRSGENMIVAVEEIKKIVEKVKQEKFPDNLHVSITNDLSVKTKNQVSDLINNIVFGVILVVGVLMFFLGFRNASFVGLAIPLSMLMSLVILSLMGVTLNTMVLFALVMGLGMLVDNGIVVVDNVFTLIDEGMSPKEAAKQGLGEIAWPIIASTATTLAAFFPLALWPGTMGKFMFYFPFTLSIVLGSSLFIALVVNAMITSEYMSKGESVMSKKRLVINSIIFFVVGVLFLGFGLIKDSAGARGIGNLLIVVAALLWAYKYFLYPASMWFQTILLPKLENFYMKVLTYILSFYKSIFFISLMIVLLISTKFLLEAFPPKVLFFPENEPNQVHVYIEYPEGTEIEKTNKTTKLIEKKFFEVIANYQDKDNEGGEPYNFMVESLISQVGQGAANPMENMGSAAETPHKGKVSAILREFKLRKGKKSSDFLEEVRAALGEYPGVNISVEKDKVGPPAGYPINLEISGPDYQQLLVEVEKLREHISNLNVNGLEGLKIDVNSDYPELLVNVDRQSAGELGVTSEMIGGTLRRAIYGWEVSRFKPINDDDYEINVRLKKSQRSNISDLENQNVIFTNPTTGQILSIPISTLSDKKITKTFTAIKHEEYKRVITIYSNVLEGFTPNEVVADMRDKLSSYDLPTEISYKFTGEIAEQEKNQSFLSFALILGVVGIIVVIVLQFNSISRPLIILFTVLLSFIGVFYGLIISGDEFVILMTMMGIISLAGIVVNNAIVLIDYTDFLIMSKKKELGISEDKFLPIEEIRKSIILGGKYRLRPVLLTAITTVLGLIPLAIGLNVNFFTLFTDFDADIYVGGDNVIFWGPLAWTVIYGLSFATFLTLLVVPTLYYLIYLIKFKIFKSKIHTIN